MNHVCTRLAAGANILGLPPVTSLLALLIFLFGACGVVLPYTVEYFALIPGNSILFHYFIWNGFTAPFFELNIIKIAFNAGAVIAIGRVLEPVWKWRKFIRVLGLSIVCSASVIVFGSLVLYRATVDASYLDHKTYGTSSLTLVMLLGLNQEWPDANVPYLTSYGIKFGHLLQAALAVVPLLAIFGHMPDIVACFVSVYASWIYLRYFCENPDGTIGDRTDAFAMLSLFPSKMRPAMAPILTAASLCSGCCGCVHTEQRRKPSQNNIGSHAEEGAAVAERRRARALKALDQKLQEIENLEDEPLDDWDGLLSDEEPESSTRASRIV